MSLTVHEFTLLADQLMLVACPVGTYAGVLEVALLQDVPAVLQAVMLSAGGAAFT